MPADLYELAEERLADLEEAGCAMRETGEADWRGACPLCGNDDLTLSVDEERERLWLGCSHASCDYHAVHQALGITQADLKLTAGQAKRRRPNLRSPDLNKIRPVRWASKQRILIGKPGLVVANEGTGKGVVSSYLAAGWTRGTIEGDLYGRPVNVLIIGDEDALDDTWTPRLEAVGADFARVKFQEVDDFDIDFTEPGDIEHLRGWIRRYKIKAVIFDALLDHVGGANVDEFKAKAVRHAMRPIRRLAADEDIAVLGSMHPRKGRVLSFRDLIANSHQFNAVSRSSLLLANHPEDPDDNEGRRVLIVAKRNLSGHVPALEFRIEGAVVKRPRDGMLADTQRAIEWAECEVTLQAAMGSSSGSGHRGTFDATKWDAVIEALTEEPQSGRVIASTADVALSTAQRYLSELAFDEVAVKTESGAWIRGPQWAVERASEHPGEIKLKGRAPTDARDDVPEAPRDRRPGTRAGDVVEAPGHNGLPDDAAGGPSSHAEERRARAREAIRLAKEQAP